MPQNLRQAPEMRRLFLPSESFKDALPAAAAMRAAVAIGYVPGSNQFGNISISTRATAVSRTTLLHNSDLVDGEGSTLVTGYSSVMVTANGTVFDLLLSDADGDYEFRGNAYSNSGQLEMDGTFTDADGVETPFTYLVNDDGSFQNIGGGQGLGVVSNRLSHIIPPSSSETSTGLKKSRSIANRTGVFDGQNGDGVQYVITAGAAAAIVFIVVVIIFAVCSFAQYISWFSCDASDAQENGGWNTQWKRDKIKNHWDTTLAVC